jgi:hypothetical protein
MEQRAEVVDFGNLYFSAFSDHLITYCPASVITYCPFGQFNVHSQKDLRALELLAHFSKMKKNIIVEQDKHNYST